MPDISIGRLRGGFCVYWYEQGKRVRHQLKARTRKEAEAEGLDVFKRRTRTDTTRTTTLDCWREYRRSLRDRPTGRTLDYTGKAILATFGHLPPDAIRRDHAEQFMESRLRDGKRMGTVHTELGHLRSALRYAEKTGLIEKAPHVWRPPKPDTDKRILNAGEARKLIDSAHDPHIRLCIILLLGTAGRVGAVLDLEWDRVDFERGTINLRIPDAQTRKGRSVVPMNNMTRAALQTAHDAALSDYVVEYGGKQVKSIRKGFTNAVKRAGLDGLTIHGLRHTAAVHMLQAGVPLTMVSQYLGHSNTAITFKTYARYAPWHMQEAADVLDFTRVKSVS